MTYSSVPAPAKESDLPARTSPEGLERFMQTHSLLGGNNAAWKDVYIQIFSHQKVKAPFLVPSVAEPMIVWVINGAATVEERELGGKWMSTDVRVGDFFLTQSPAPYEMRWESHGDQPFQVMHVYLSIPLIKTVARDLLGQGKSHVTLPDISGAHDETISQLLHLINQEIQAPQPENHLYIQGIAQSLAVHLIRKYAQTDTRKPADGPRLPAFKLRRVQAYMETHLDEKFDLGKCAREAGSSTYHFSRLFKKSAGTSPSQYFIHQKMAKAQQLLLETNMSILEIALAVGYESPGHFSQVFKRETGLSPREYRRD
ncbi:helix-turn-helix domain-containing protein [Thalassospira alkalitolerans]|uniref:AraC family transcriptional regulator n=1 Tax=Thalassospira alkalitolerans TaxID=1293890 RepID=A0A1Y2LBZ7_9PROT|nr:AraC family transcriptional regulator [Thalassospira alkalitolerans]OSQ48336.1 AraC family transcriptional regulator [Thalassospira alkalitolerans]